MTTISKKALFLLVGMIPPSATEMAVTSISRSLMPPMTVRCFTTAFAHSGKRNFSSRSMQANRIFPAQTCRNNKYAHRRRSTSLFMSDNTNKDVETTSTSSTVDIPQMKKEITRLSLRTVKKIGKVSVRIQAAEDQLAKVRAAMESQEVDEALLEQLEQSPSEATLTEHRNDMTALQTRLKQLNWLEEQFNNPPLKKKGSLTSEELLQLTDSGEQILEYIAELQINDTLDAKNKRAEEDARNKMSKKQSQMQRQQQKEVEGSRLPYRRYYTENNIEIKVRLFLCSLFIYNKSRYTLTSRN